ncbi:pyridine nucleotide-disulfide oxidoreductase [Cephaloticoccus primus]|uniref:Pyridine nucleotide-disulfide oxidoreductase n=1 Tax=Cephaloticoccus primus TaxID=1548207 RepID=A0A139SPP8_9BACT|nr:NAD(P)/FAD-dependent oxidoreductase [Cephaloticoccus primus]KXU36569.1 pyridine nucleotide-disulfide oxidoreductase [Cephaloticoccus primus]
MPAKNAASPPTAPYDLAVLGGGSAGYNAARTATALGLKTALIDGACELGGLCILNGCMPSKTLLHVADTLHQARHASRLGLRIPHPAADMLSIQSRKRRIIADFAAYRQEQLHSGDFTLIRHHAHFVDPHTLQLDNESEEQIRARHILIATGSHVSTPSIPGLAQAQCWTSDDVLNLDSLPQSVIVLGGGIVACELAQLLARLGSRVTLIQRSAQLLREHSPEAAAVIESALRDEGVEIITGTQLHRVTREPSRDTGKLGFTVEFEHGGAAQTRHALHCLNAFGRTPHTAALNLAAADVKTAPTGHIRTNRWQQTSAPHIYAAGDCAGPHEIVHLAIQQAELAVRHIHQNPSTAKTTKTKTAKTAESTAATPLKPIDEKLHLSVVFTDPQLATIGLGERALKDAKTPYLSASYPFADHGKAILLEATRGYVKLFAAPKTGRLLGAEIVGRDAGELIHCFSAALALRATVFDMLKAPWYHPTLAEIFTYPLEEIAEQINAAG